MTEESPWGCGASVPLVEEDELGTPSLWLLRAATALTVMIVFYFLVDAVIG